MTRKKLQSGFTLVEDLLIILILVIVGFAGYHVWDRQSSKDQTAKKSATTSKTDKNTQRSTDNTAKWLTFSPEDRSYQIKLPDGWRFDYNPTDKLLYVSTENMKDTNDIQAVVNTTTGGYGIGTGFVV